MPQRSGLRRVHTFTHSDNATQREQINMSGYVRALKLRLTGTIAVTSNATNVMNFDPENLISSINIWLNNEEILHTGRMIDFRIRNGVFGKLGTQDQVGTTVTSGASPYAFTSIVEIPFEIPAARKGADTILSLPSADRLDIEVTWGDTTSLINGGTVVMDGASSSVVPTLIVLADIVRVAQPPTHVYKTGAFDSDALGTSANTSLEIPITTSARRNYHHLVVTTEDVNNAAGGGRNLEAVTINDITLRQESGGEVSNIIGPITGTELQEEFDLLSANENGIQTGVLPIVFQSRHSGMRTFNVATGKLSDLRWLVDHGTFGTSGRIRTIYGTIEELR